MTASRDSHDRLLPFLRRYCPFRRTVLLLVLLLAHPTVDATAGNKAGAKSTANATPLGQFIEEHFQRWDGNRDGVLDRERNRPTDGKPVCPGAPRAAVLVTIYRQIRKGETNGELSHLTKEELLTSAGDRDFQREVNRGLAGSSKRLTGGRSLPATQTFPRSIKAGWGDCYLLAAIAAAVHRDPQADRNMIHPAKNDGFNVVIW